MTAEEMWAAFIHRAGIASDTPYEAWAFGDAPDKLAQLTLDGSKTATASAHALYAIEGEKIPQVGEYSVILDSAERAICVICDTRVTITRYPRITHIKRARGIGVLHTGGQSMRRSSPLVSGMPVCRSRRIWM